MNRSEMSDIVTASCPTPPVNTRYRRGLVLRVGADPLLEVRSVATGRLVSRLTLSATINWEPLEIGSPDSSSASSLFAISHRRPPYGIDIAQMTTSLSVSSPEADEETLRSAPPPPRLALVSSPLRGHTDNVRCMCRVETGPSSIIRFASAAEDGTLLLWAAEDEQQQQHELGWSFELMSRYVCPSCPKMHSIEFISSRGNGWLFGGEYGHGFVRIFDLETQQLLHSWKHGGERVWRIRSFGDRLLFTSGNDRFLRGWDLNSGICVMAFEDSQKVGARKNFLCMKGNDSQIVALSGFGHVGVFDIRRNVGLVSSFRVHRTAMGNAFGLCEMNSRRSSTTFVSCCYYGNEISSWEIGGKILKKTRRADNWGLCFYSPDNLEGA